MGNIDQTKRCPEKSLKNVWALKKADEQARGQKKGGLGKKGGRKKKDVHGDGFRSWRP